MRTYFSIFLLLFICLFFPSNITSIKYKGISKVTSSVIRNVIVKLSDGLLSTKSTDDDIFRLGGISALTFLKGFDEASFLSFDRFESRQISFTEKCLYSDFVANTNLILNDANFRPIAVGRCKIYAMTTRLSKIVDSKNRIPENYILKLTNDAERFQREKEMYEVLLIHLHSYQ
jgi:hypothetical protein